MGLVGIAAGGRDIGPAFAFPGERLGMPKANDARDGFRRQSDSDPEAVGKVLAVTAGDEISFTTGKASILMKKDGTIVISGKDISVTGSGQITAKATKDMVLKGKKILQN